MGLDHVRKVFEKLGREDAMYGVLTEHRYRGGRWDPDRFFAHGRQEIEEVLAYVDRLPETPARERALDFGCGVGRLSQALAEHYDHVLGLDISHTMIEEAKRHDRHPEKVRYLLNTSGDLRLLERDCFDLVYTSKTLQHIHPRYQAGYIGEFVRVLKPGGLAIFQVRNGPPVRPGSLRGWVYDLNRVHFRRLWQKLRRRPGYEMHYLARSLVEEAVTGAGGEVVDVVDVNPRRAGKSLRYAVTK